MVERLTPDQVRRVCDPQSLGCESTRDLPPTGGLIGQPRAVAALRFGLGMTDSHYHIFAAGLPGTGRVTAIRSFLEELARTRPTPDDWCYVFNFAQPDRPQALRLPAGRGRALVADMRRLLEAVQRQLPRVFESDAYTQRRDQILNELQRRRGEMLAALEQRARAEGFALQAMPGGLLLIPLLHGQPLSDEALAALPPEIRRRIDQRRQHLEEEVRVVLKELRNLERRAHERLHELDRQAVLSVVGDLIEDLVERYRDLPAVVRYLEAVREDLLQTWPQLRLPAEEPAMAPLGLHFWQRERVLRRYQVNLIVDNAEVQGAPVVMEIHPSYANLIGYVEREVVLGVPVTDFTLIRAGALHRANGGYLVLTAEDVLRQPGAWDGLKRTLRTNQITIEEVPDLFGLIGIVPRGLRPEPIPLEAKIILVGAPLTFYLLYWLDPDFRELFKVRADFALTMDRTPENERAYAQFAAMLCQKENLLPFDCTALAALVEHGSRLAEDQRKLSTHFGALADVMREADYWARQERVATVSRIHVRRALEEKIYRSNLIEERIQELIARGIILVDVSGAVVGQVNGLAVSTLADLTFGRPTRITATIGAGREGVIDIEREVRLGGPIHSKGVLILGGFLVDRFAQDKPLTLHARLVFEQSYEEVEGDSASSAELYALLSRLADVPIRQGLAVTGSVNQRGEVQAIGGVNEKIEGFFAACKAKGLTGDQGVIIPASNVDNLMLNEEVVDAVAQGRFHIYPVRTIEEGISLLTGLPAGRRLPDGTFEPETIFWRVDRRLRELARSLRAAAREEREGEGN